MCLLVLFSSRIITFEPIPKIAINYTPNKNSSHKSNIKVNNSLKSIEGLNKDK